MTVNDHLRNAANTCGNNGFPERHSFRDDPTEGFLPAGHLAHDVRRSKYSVGNRVLNHARPHDVALNTPPLGQHLELPSMSPFTHQGETHGRIVAHDRSRCFDQVCEAFFWNLPAHLHDQRSVIGDVVPAAKGCAIARRGVNASKVDAVVDAPVARGRQEVKGFEATAIVIAHADDVIDRGVDQAGSGSLPRLRPLRDEADRLRPLVSHDDPIDAGHTHQPGVRSEKPGELQVNDGGPVSTNNGSKISHRPRVRAP